MAVLDKGLKQRMVGALVLVALAVIFLPMLFSREDELKHVVVEAPPMPQAPSAPEVALEPVKVPEPQPTAEEPLSPREVIPPVEPLTTQTAPPAAVPGNEPSATAPKAAESHLDANTLPVSWSVQLASLSSRAGAESLQQTLRSKGYNAYIRSVDGMNRVFVGPLVERAEADRLRDLLGRQQKLNGFVVRFQPESD
jgi:DedD protein